MAIKKISELVELTVLNGTDALVINEDNGGGSYITKQIQSSVLLDNKLNVSVFQNASGTWQDTYSTVNATSASWNETPEINYVSGIVSGHTLSLSVLAGNDTYLSGQINIKLNSSILQSASGTWQDTYSTVNSNSASWDESPEIGYVSGLVASNTIAIANIASTSGTWNTVTGKLDTSIYQNTSGRWQSTYSSVNANSATWNTVTDSLEISDFNIAMTQIGSSLSAMVLYADVSGNRPVTDLTGQMFYDLDLGYPIVWGGSYWKNFSGGAV